MSIVKDIFKAYKASDYRDPEFDGMVSDLAKLIGISPDDVPEILSGLAESDEFGKIKLHASGIMPVTKKQMQLFKRAQPAGPSALLDVLVKAIAGDNSITKKDLDDAVRAIKSIADGGDANLKAGLAAAINAKKAAPDEVIDDMPVIKLIEQLDPATFVSVKAAYGAQSSVAGTVSAVRGPAMGAADEVDRLVDALKIPDPDAAHVERFKQIAKARLPSYRTFSKDFDAIHQLLERFRYDPQGLRTLVGSLGLEQAEQIAIIENFKYNRDIRLPQVLKNSTGILASLDRAFQGSRIGLGPLERLKEMAKVGKWGAVQGAKLAYIVPRLLWKIPRIGKVLGLAFGAGQTLWMGNKISEIFGNDDDKPDASAPADSSAGGASAPGSIADPALTGNLHQKMRTILKRTFGPR